MTKASRPNVVFIMTDTQNKNMIGAYGLPQTRTPNAIQHR